MLRRIVLGSFVALIVVTIAVTAQEQGARPRRGPGPGMRPGGFGPGQADESFMVTKALAKDDSEKKILDVLGEMDNERRGMMNCSPEDGRLLRLLTETLGAKHVVEIGTSNGYSGIWFSLALRTTGGRLVTHDIDKGRFDLATKNFARAGVSDVVTQVFGDAHETVKAIKDPIDILFLDADKEGYIDYLKTLMPLVRPGGLILAHNMNPRQADQRYIEAITTDANLETLLLLKDGAGISVTMKKR